MRWVGCLLLLLVGTGWFLARIDVDNPVVADVLTDSSWRRTRDGWERSDSWGSGHRSGIQTGDATSRLNIPLPHPLLLAVLEAMTSILVLVAFSPGRSAEMESSPQSDIKTTQPG